MGCDIHGWVEKKVKDKWIAVKELRDDERNYERFSRLAGVRHYADTEPPNRPKGIPKDVSDTAATDIASWDSDGHSHSWMPLDEAFKIFKETQREEHYSDWKAFGVDLENERCKACGQILPLEEYRLVFWFDN